MPVKEAKLRFYEELNDFLHEDQKKKDLALKFFNSPSVKDAIESFGIPHTEVDLILINGESAEFSQKVKANDRVSVYPKFETFDISKISKLRNQPLRNIQFIVDVHLGKLARYLRLCGFDTLYENDYQDREIVELSLRDKRIILTRDIGILKHNKVQHGYWIRSDLPRIQLTEVIRRFDLKDQVNPFRRCMKCNGTICKTNKEKIMNELPERIQKYVDDLFQCTKCKRLYWKGSHYWNMVQFIRNLL